MEKTIYIVTPRNSRGEPSSNPWFTDCHDSAAKAVLDGHDVHRVVAVPERIVRVTLEFQK
jgi:hypothetical protein